MKGILVLLAILFSCDIFAQIPLLGRSRSEVESKVRLISCREVSFTDSTVSFKLSFDPRADIAVTCHFFEKGNCHMISFSSKDSLACSGFLGEILKHEKYRWRKINGNQYVSKFSKRLLLETDPDKSKRTFRILPAQWTRKTYKLINSY